MPNIDFSIGIGGAAGQGVATPGNILAKLFARRGLHINAYNAYQSIIRGGHTFLTIRTSREPVRCMGDGLDMLIPLNQDTMDRHLSRMRPGSSVLFDFDKTAIKPDGAKILDRLIVFLKENSDKKVDLEGHTDSVGTDQYNQKLSERRAASVKDYLTQRGVDVSDIVSMAAIAVIDAQQQSLAGHFG